jgi:hypothetical protein
VSVLHLDQVSSLDHDNLQGSWMLLFGDVKRVLEQVGAGNIAGCGCFDDLLGRKITSVVSWPIRLRPLRENSWRMSVPHPSPLPMQRQFFGLRPFTRMAHQGRSSLPVARGSFFSFFTIDENKTE